MEQYVESTPIQGSNDTLKWVLFFILLIGIIIGLIFLFSGKPIEKQEKAKEKPENSTIIIDVRDYVTNERITAIISGSSKSNNFQRNIKPSSYEEIFVKVEPYRVLAQSEGYFEDSICFYRYNESPLYKKECNSDSTCELDYFCDLSRPQSRYKGVCKLRTPFECKDMCFNETCKIFLKKKAVVGINFQEMDSSLAILKTTKGSTEFYSFPMELCLSYLPSQFDTIRLDLQKKDMPPNPFIDKCYLVVNDSEIRMNKIGKGNISLFIDSKNFTIETFK